MTMLKTANFLFRFMSFGFKIRDIFSPRKNIISDIGIRPGFRVLDFGCGPGAYIPAAESLIGKTGHIYALDAQPLATEYVQAFCRKNKLSNVTSIMSDCATGLRGNSIDIIFLYDVLHGLSYKQRVLHELHRVLKEDGILSVNDHHLMCEEIIKEVTATDNFKFHENKSKSLSFSKK